jgi:hypothetical protein
MLLKFRIWKNNLSPAKQLVVSFLLYWVYWLVAWLIFEKLYNKSFHSATYHIMHATWMGGFWLLFSKWKLIKQVFAKKQEQ